MAEAMTALSAGSSTRARCSSTSLGSGVGGGTGSDRARGSLPEPAATRPIRNRIEPTARPRSASLARMSQLKSDSS